MTAASMAVASLIAPVSAARAGSGAPAPPGRGATPPGSKVLPRAGALRAGNGPGIWHLRARKIAFRFGLGESIPADARQNFLKNQH